MCNLYTNKASAAEVAAVFKATMPTAFNAGPGDVYPAGIGMVVREDAGMRVLQSMTWGFPLPQKSKKTGLPIKPKPVNNIADLGSFMWRFVAPELTHRCLIPMTGFAEAEGEWKAKTRTWFTLRDQPIFAWAGMWKMSDEWGPVYSGLMTDANEAIAPVHNRMPVLLMPDEWDTWMHGDLETVQSFQTRVFPPEHVQMDRTQDPWFKPRGSDPSMSGDQLL